MTTIWKFPIHRARFSLLLSADAQVRYLATLDGRPYVWIQLDTEQMTSLFHFGIFGTGHELYDAWGRRSYAGTWQEENSVWHLYWGPHQEGEPQPEAQMGQDGETVEVS